MLSEALLLSGPVIAQSINRLTDRQRGIRGSAVLKGFIAMGRLSTVYKFITRRTNFVRPLQASFWIAVLLLTANCGNFTANSISANSVDATQGTGTGDGGGQVFIPSTPAPTPTPGTTSPPAPVATERFGVLSYNIQAIPCLRDNAVSTIGDWFGVKKCALKDNVWTRKNRERIANLMVVLQGMRDFGDAPDVVVLQEAFLAKNDLFDDDDVTSIPARSGYPYVAYGPAAKVLNGTDDYWNIINQDKKALKGLLNSGLMILSKYPIESFAQIEYGDLCAVEDCNSNKGALLIKIRHPRGFTVDIVNTHMQAERPYDAIRDMQAIVYASFVKQNRSSDYLVLGGDFNTRMQLNTPQMQTITTELGVTHSGQVCVASGAACVIPEGTSAAAVGGDNLDHVFFRAPVGVTVPVTRGFMPQWTFSGGFLSDHMPLIIEMGFSP